MVCAFGLLLGAKVAPVSVRLVAPDVAAPLAVTIAEPTPCAVIVTVSPSFVPEIGGENRLIGMICSWCELRAGG